MSAPPLPIPDATRLTDLLIFAQVWTTYDAARTEAERWARGVVAVMRVRRGFVCYSTRLARYLRRPIVAPS